MSFEGEAMERGLHTLAQRDGRDHDLTATIGSKHGFPIFSDKVTLVSTGSTGVDNFWKNETGFDILILDAYLDITTEASGAATADMGIGSTSTTSDDTLIDAADVGAAVILATAGNNAGNNGGTARVCPADYYVTLDWEADPSGLVGTMWVLYAPLG